MSRHNEPAPTRFVFPSRTKPPRPLAIRPFLPTKRYHPNPHDMHFFPQHTPPIDPRKAVSSARRSRIFATHELEKVPFATNQTRSTASASPTPPHPTSETTTTTAVCAAPHAPKTTSRYRLVGSFRLRLTTSDNSPPFSPDKKPPHSPRRRVHSPATPPHFLLCASAELLLRNALPSGSFSLRSMYPSKKPVGDEPPKPPPLDALVQAFLPTTQTIAARVRPLPSRPSTLSEARSHTTTMPNTQKYPCVS